MTGTEKQMVSTLIAILENRGNTLSAQEVEETAFKLAEMFVFTGNIEEVIRQALTAVNTRMGEGVSLIDHTMPHDDEWVSNRPDKIKWIYSDAYNEYLQKENWSETLVQDLNRVTERILGYLQDPLCQGAWSRRGLVIGHVQSGKTANYTGLIAKAADAGYKFIIVSAGIHNNLRKQTQERIDEGFVGRSSDPKNRKPIGVGNLLGNENYPCPATLTNINEDFNKKTAQTAWKINNYINPTILVIKKNVRTLTALHDWLQSLNAAGDGRIADVPMLFIDDEADHASINTNKPDLDPTKTNAWIRKILRLFAKSAYVGYTATPFANIFINPDAYDDEVREELFPRDFIYSLDASTSYFGPDKVFLDEDKSQNIIRTITDCEDYLPLTHKKDYLLAELPPSLYRTVHQFIVARAIRNLRGQAGKPCSMLINVSRFVDIQRAVRTLLELYLKKLHAAVKASYAMPEDFSSQNPYMRSLQQVFLEDYCGCEFTWEEIKISLLPVFETIRLFVVNSRSDEVLDYKKYENDDQGLTAIAVGGLSLSRGLTVHGLCTSYMYRSTKMYDTLMQMGRWFGYRQGYEDLCLIHLSPDSIDWYSYIARASDELRYQIIRMNWEKLSPKQFGLYVRAHPDALLVTAINKMRYAEKVKIKQNYSGRLIESYLIPEDKNINFDNEQLITEYWQNRFGTSELKETGKGWIAENVNISEIETFLLKFISHPSFRDQKNFVIKYLREINEIHPKGDVLFISPREGEIEQTDYLLNVQKRSPLKEVNEGWQLRKNRVASRGDEKLGLTDSQLVKVQKKVGPDKLISDIYYREVRNKPLLMLHILSTDGENRVPAFGVSFPSGLYNTEIEVVANKVLLKQLRDSVPDDPDDEEDYDYDI